MKKNFLKIFIFIMIIFLSPKVFAAEFNMNSYTSATLNGTKNRYRSTEIYNYGSSGTYTFGTQYNGRISDIETYFNYPFSANLTYTLTYNMNTDDFRNTFGTSYWWYCDQEMSNTNAHVVSANYINYRKVKLSFTTDQAATCIRVWLRSTNINSTAITGVSNWRLNSITIYDPEWQDGTTSGSGSQGTTSGSSGTTPNNSNQDIINNNNQNTSDIINNNNQNTSDIINNQNNNTFNNCSIKDYTFQSRYLGWICNSTGGFCNNNDFFASDYVRVKPGYTYTINFKDIDNLSYGWFCWYNNDELISCSQYRNTDGYGVTMSITPPDNANKLTVTYKKDSGASISGYICTNPETDVSNALTDSNVDNGVGSDFFSGFNNNMHGLSSIITIPLSSIQALSSATCSPLHIPIPFTNNKYLDLPCMSAIYQQHIPTLLTLIQTCWYGILAYKIVVDIFYIVKGFKDPDSDKIEVLDL